MTGLTAPTVTIPASTTLGTAASLSFAVDSLNNTNAYAVIDTGTINGVTTAFGIVDGPPGAVYGVDYDVVYRDTNTPNLDITSPSLGAPLANSVNRVLIVAKTSSVAPVKLADFKSGVRGAGVMLSWKAVCEYKNAGFNLYRQEAGASEWTRVNAALIAGRITNPDEKIYAFYDWAQPGTYQYKLESVALFGAAETYEKFTDAVTLDGDAPASAPFNAASLDAAESSVEAAAGSIRTQELSAQFAAAAGAPVSGPQAAGNAPVPQAIVRELGLNAPPPPANAFATARAVSSGTPALPPSNPQSIAAAGARFFSSSSSSTTTSFVAAKVVYDTPGVLWIPQVLMPAGFNVQHCLVQREGITLVPLAVTPDGVLVFAPGYQDDYTGKDALFIRNTGAPTAAGQATSASGLFAGTQTVNATSPASVTTDYHDVYFDYNYRPYNFAPWFSSEYLTSGTTQTFALGTPNASSGAATLTVNLWSLAPTGSAPSDTTLQVLVNGQPAGQAVWSGGDKMMQLTFEIASGVLVNGSNQIDLVTPAADGTDGRVSFLHSMTVAYTQTLNGSKPLSIVNAADGSQLFEVSSLPGASAWVVDARYPDRAALVPYEAQAQADGTYTLRFTANPGGTGQYLVVPVGQENEPLSIEKRQVKPLKSAGVYMATGPSQFSPGVQPLLAQRSKEGVRGYFVDQEQLFDYYNYGRYGPAGIQNAVRSVRPQYLLLLGRTTYDYKNYSGLNIDPLCPAFLVSTTFWAQSTSDAMFGDLGRGYPEVAVGRLPANNPGELSVAVNHILSFKGAPPPASEFTPWPTRPIRASRTSGNSWRRSRRTIRT